MSSHSDAVSRIVLEFPSNRRASAPRSSAIRSHGPGANSAFAALVSYLDLLATRCISAARPLRVGWPQAAAVHSVEKSESESHALLRKVSVNQFEDLVVLKVTRSGKRPKIA